MQDRLDKYIKEYESNNLRNILVNPLFRIKVTHFIAIFVLVISALFFTHDTVGIFLQLSLAVIVFFHDMDDRYLKSALSKKIQILREQEFKLIELKDIAETSVKSKDEFLANMSHEIRTPMNAILGFVSVLKKQSKDEKSLKYLNIIDESGKSLLTIINDILDFAKIQSGQFYIDRQPTQVIAEFSNTILLFASKVYEKHLIYVTYIDPKIPSIIALDSNRVKQVFYNILSNAIKFTPNYGKINVLITFEKNDLVISVEDSGIGIAKEKQSKIFSAFEQADISTTRKFGGTGLGLSISASLVELMDGSLSVESVEGEGSTFHLRLPTEIIDAKATKLIDSKKISNLTFALLNSCEECKENMELIKKYLYAFGVKNIIELDSFQKDSYDVLFFIPDDEYNEDIINSKILSIAMLRTDFFKIIDSQYIKPLNAPFVPKSIIEALTDLGIENIKIEDRVDKDENSVQFKGTILVVEDNLTNQALISVLLDDYGLNYKIANDGLEAVAIFQKESFDLILMDENMPNLNGVESSLEIKKYEEKHSLTRTPVIAFTASVLDRDRDKFLVAGFDGFLAKPVDVKALERVLDRYLNL
ncbi:MAG: ATP-binding protein [Campylobacterota bacterium]|nr:ATP-binding protein [Campylobacterota bacterium]